MTQQYTDGVIAGMQMLYGEGFLSPGGAGEVADLLRGVDVSGQRVLDVGCGLGGLAMLLVREYNASHVTGVDIEDELVLRAGDAVANRNLGERIIVRTVEPGPLPFDDAAFDVAITKDVICHMPDKAAFLIEAYRVLKPGGTMVIADFFDNRAVSSPDAVDAYEGYVDGMARYGLKFAFEPADRYVRALTEAGFDLTDQRDHTDVSATVARRERDILSRDASAIRAALGEQRYDLRCQATEFRGRALESRGLMHGHLIGKKPT